LGKIIRDSVTGHFLEKSLKLRIWDRTGKIRVAKGKDEPRGSVLERERFPYIRCSGSFYVPATTTAISISKCNQR
jgi:hypothetical protein